MVTKTTQDLLDRVRRCWGNARAREHRPAETLTAWISDGGMGTSLNAPSLGTMAPCQPRA